MRCNEMRQTAALALVVMASLLGASGCKFEVSYPDSYAVDLGGQDAQADQEEPTDTVSDIGPVQCFTSSDCLIKLGDTGACREWQCANNQCAAVYMKDGTACDDQSLCTYDDQCNAGLCAGQGTVACPDDGDPCTQDFCDPNSGECSYQPLETCGKCLAEGELGVLPVTCCNPGMNPIVWYGGTTTPGEECTAQVGGQVTCAACGNGVCGTGEDYCSCPDDCGDSNTCYTEGDCSAGQSCVSNKCVTCGMEVCDNLMDEDCDGQTDEQPCQQFTCGFNPFDYPSVPLSVILLSPWAYNGAALSTVGTSTMGATACTAACYAPLLLKDTDLNGNALKLELMVSDTYNPVECKGPDAGSMTCYPINLLGVTIVAWGHLNTEGPKPRLELDGYCQQ